MRTLIDANRYQATPELRRQFGLQGRQASWAARQVGISRSQMSRVMAGRRSLDERSARLLAALLGLEFGVLFKVPYGTDRSPPGVAGAGAGRPAFSRAEPRERAGCVPAVEEGERG